MQLAVWPNFSLRYGIVETKLNSFDSITDVMANKLLDNKENYIFRGHRRSDWKLEPTLTRHLRKTGATLKPNEHLEYFKKAIIGRRGINPPQLQNDECWALGQHFGLYTPLLDWTNSPYVGLFFAFAEEGTVEDRTDTRVLFALNRKRIEEKCKRIQRPNVPISFIEPYTDDNLRLLTQSGLFTSTEITIEIEEWVRSNFPQKHNKAIILKLHIANDLRLLILKQLNWMNINLLTLFPDVFGAAKHANLKCTIPGY
ncbi:MAG: FRG domain-containing protein [Deltaproteobacteria bacterium]|nr:FRG domain-containing protein [Deltaproteobacteria bacterium]